MAERGKHFSRNDIDVALVRGLIASQFPQWAGLAIEPVEVSGWDNRTFHLGDDMSVRLPSAAAYAAQVEKEHRWLPKLAPRLPLPIPAPLAKGAPDHRYPWPWSVYRWLEGETAIPQRIRDLDRFAATLAAFLVALERVDASGGPLAGPHSFHRRHRSRRGGVASRSRFELARRCRLGPRRCGCREPARA